jgi:aspartate/methionine/tyrosine aminotransferase
VAIPLLGDEPTAAETRAIGRCFREKRDYVLGRLRKMGVGIDLEPEGTFYIWGRLSDLPPPLNDGMGLFRAALEQKVITVPGQFFDVNPGKRRGSQSSRFTDYTRFSFGPSLSVLRIACDRLESVIAAAKSGSSA